MADDNVLAAIIMLPPFVSHNMAMVAFIYRNYNPDDCFVRDTVYCEDNDICSNYFKVAQSIHTALCALVIIAK